MWSQETESCHTTRVDPGSRLMDCQQGTGVTLSDGHRCHIISMAEVSHCQLDTCATLPQCQQDTVAVGKVQVSHYQNVNMAHVTHCQRGTVSRTRVGHCQERYMRHQGRDVILSASHICYNVSRINMLHCLQAILSTGHMYYTVNKYHTVSRSHVSHCHQGTRERITINRTEVAHC